VKIKQVENFFDVNDLDLISSLKLYKKIDDNDNAVYHNSISKNGNIIRADLISGEILKSFQERYHKTAINILNELFPEKVELYDYSEFHIVETGKNFVFPIHDDIPNKLLSGVVYIKPKKNLGTIFYETKNGNNKRVIEWEVNKAVFFSRSERKTWHSYSGDGISNRLTVVYNLMTNDVKKVFDIEGKNYLYGRFRSFINPYLFRFFKKTI
tara:strand:- start:392 stop:1024 length:633 start_codon:yes stop_codon:yes gene_type:complete